MVQESRQEGEESDQVRLLGLSASQSSECVLAGYILLLLCRLPIDNLTPEERDARTVFCMQLAARIRPRDLEEFFSAVGKVRPFVLTSAGSPDQEVVPHSQHFHSKVFLSSMLKLAYSALSVL